MSVDFAIITILDEEYYALDQHFKPRPQHYASGRTYGICQVQSLEGKDYTVAIRRCSEQGPNVAQHLAQDMIRDLSPSLLLVVGIAGAVPSPAFTLGDVIISSRIHDFSINAYKTNEIQWDVQGGIHPYISEITANLPMYKSRLQGWDTPTFIKFPRPEIDSKKFKNFDLMRLTQEDKKNIFDGTPPIAWQEKILDGLKRNFGIPLRRNQNPVFHIGSVASSGSLIRDPLILIKWLQTARSIQAFEMEAAGVFQAAEQLLKQYPVMTIRGISDIPGLSREDDWKLYACHSAAAFTYAFIKAGIVEPQASSYNTNPLSASNITCSLMSASHFDHIQADITTIRAPSHLEAAQNSQENNAKKTINVYISYSESDEELKAELEIHLAQLQRQGVISPWHNRQIEPGMVRDSVIDMTINNAQVILLLVSPHFIASPYTYEREVLRALERQKSGDVHVIPVLLRPSDWRNTPFGQLQPLPRNNKPVVIWENRDEAWYEIVQELRQLYIDADKSILAATAPKANFSRPAQAENISAIKSKTVVEPEPITATTHDIASPSAPLTTDIVPKQYVLVNSFKGLASRVRCLAFSPEGYLLASGGDDGSIKLWELSTGNSIQTLKGHANVTSGLTFSPDGQLLASSGDDGSIKLWEPSTGRTRQTIRAHTDWVSCIAFSPDGHLLASGSDDGSIKLWEVPAGKIVGTLKGNTDWIYSLAFSPGGRLLASGSLSKSIKVWNISTQKTAYTLKGHANMAASVAFSPDGHLLANGNDDGSIELWEVSTSKALGTLIEHSRWVRCVIFSSNGQLLASGSDDQTIKLWNVATRKVAQTLIGHTDRVESVIFSLDGHLIASGGRDKTIILWGIKTT